MKLGMAAELWQFMRKNKKWWLLPIVTTLLFIGLILVFATSSALAPFIYTIF